MLKTICLSGALLLLASGVASSESLKWEEVTEGVFAVIQPSDRLLDESNSLVIITDIDVVLIDTQANPAITLELVQGIRERTKLPIRYLVNTHWHNDHMQGNRVILGENPLLEVVASPAAARDMVERGTPQRNERIEGLESSMVKVAGWIETGQKDDGTQLSTDESAFFRERMEWGRNEVKLLKSIVPVLPTVLVESELILRRSTGDISILGLEGHTEGDLIVYLPDLGLMATGDLVDALPFAGHGDLGQWMNSLAELSKFEIKTLVPGHGPVMSGDQIDSIRDLFEATIAQVRSLESRGLAGEALIEEIDPEPLKEDYRLSDGVSPEAFESFLRSIVEVAMEAK